MKKKVRVETSARHCHLSQKDLDKAFGKGYKLTFFKKLSQHSDFAAKETVTIENKGVKFDKVRIVGPTRNKRVVEVAMTDARKLGLKPLVSVHGQKNDPLVTVIGPKGKTKVPLILKNRHVHMTNDDAKKLGVKEYQKIKLKIGGPRAAILENVVVRIDPLYKMSAHLDTDEANAVGIDGVGEGELII